MWHKGGGGGGGGGEEGGGLKSSHVEDLFIPQSIHHVADSLVQQGAMVYVAMVLTKFMQYQ